MCDRRRTVGDARRTGLISSVCRPHSWCRVSYTVNVARKRSLCPFIQLCFIVGHQPKYGVNTQYLICKKTKNTPAMSEGVLFPSKQGLRIGVMRTGRNRKAKRREICTGQQAGKRNALRFLSEAVPHRSLRPDANWIYITISIFRPLVNVGYCSSKVENDEGFGRSGSC